MDEYFVEEKSSWDKILDFLVFIAVFAVTIFLILELIASTGVSSIDITNVTEIYFYVNLIVFVIFILDLYRLWNKSTSFSNFVKTNWLDILATIPFGLIVSALSSVKSSSPAFEIVKWLRVTKLTRVSKLSKLQKVSRISKVAKEFKAASHLKKESDTYKKKHRL